MLNLSDEKLIKIKFWMAFRRRCNLHNPQTFNEKLQWLKLYWRDPLAEICSDKYAVRTHLQTMGLAHLLNDLIAVYDNVDEIDFSRLPDKFVLKCTHGSGYNIICEDKRSLDWKAARKKLHRWMNTNYYRIYREWVYKDIKPRIICEKFLKDDAAGELYDYKFFCFNGEPEIMILRSHKPGQPARSDYYNMDWLLLPIRGANKPSGRISPRPAAFEEMTEYACQLSKGFPHVRIDLYDVNGKVYFGEMTFFHGGGFGKFYPQKVDMELGKKMELPAKI